MSQYAANTSVSVDKSQAEIRRSLNRYGAGQFVFAEEDARAMIGFTMANRQVRFFLSFKAKSKFMFTSKGRARKESQALVEWEKACRQKWRALALIVKAKLEAVESGITTFEEEFLAHIVLPGGKTYGQFAIPQIEEAYATKKLPKLLPM